MLMYSKLIVRQTESLLKIPKYKTDRFYKYSILLKLAWPNHPYNQYLRKHLTGSQPYCDLLMAANQEA